MQRPDRRVVVWRSMLPDSRLPPFPYEQPLNTLSLSSASAGGNQIQASFLSSSLGVDLGLSTVRWAPGSQLRRVA
jgi:hypothetical protein